MGLGKGGVGGRGGVDRLDARMDYKDCSSSQVGRGSLRGKGGYPCRSQYGNVSGLRVTYPDKVMSYWRLYPLIYRLSSHLLR